MNLIKKLDDKSAVIGILGLGYVGIPLALSIADVELKVLGFDIAPERTEELNAGQSPIKHIPHSEIARLRETGFEATTDFARANECDALIICVPTPLNKVREPDLSYVEATMVAISPHLRAEQLVSLESTTWPGTTKEVLLPYIAKRGFNIGEDFYLVYSPEREDPGNSHFNTSNIPKVLGGHTEVCRDVGVAFYERFIDTVVTVSSTEAAEMVKLLENIHRSVNIGLVNEIKIIADRMGLDVFEIIKGAATKPFGFTPYYPGPGIGGHCIPIDPFYLTWKAREFGLHTRFIELAGEVNAAMPQYVVDKVVRALNANGKSLKGAKVLALGIAYKRDVDDMRESPSVFVMDILKEWGADVHYSDPNLAVFPEMREHSYDLSSVELTPETVASYDALVLLTDHTKFDYDLIEANAKIIVDTRCRFDPAGETIWRA